MVTDAEVDDRIEQLTAKILKLSKQLFGAAEELHALAKMRGVSAPCSTHLLAAHAAIAAVVRGEKEPQPVAGSN